MPAINVKIRAPRHRHDANRANPLYGYGYNPAAPSILSVAHDETNGHRIYLITDRPCDLDGGDVPITVGGFTVVGAELILPIKFRLTLSGKPAQGATWTFDGGGDLYDPTTGMRANPASGTCADIVGP